MSARFPAEDNASFILVMGITGAGKSYFINKVAGKTVVDAGDRLQSCTQTAIAIPVTIGREKVVLIDTPGFDDTTRSDTEILTEISRLLTFQYEMGMELRGVVFLHRITDIRMQGSSMKTLQICRKMCGTSALKNVILVTTRWNDVDPRLGAQREHDLRTDFWKFMLDFDSIMMRYHGDQESAITIVSRLLQKDSIVLELQRELVDKGKSLAETEAGRLVNNDIEKAKAEYEKELKELAQLRSDLARNHADTKMRLQQEIETERKKLELAQSRKYAQQMALQSNIAQEVRQNVEQEKKKRSGIFKILPFLPSCLSLLGMFVGIPPGTFETFTSWFSDSSIGDALTDIFSSF